MAVAAQSLPVIGLGHRALIRRQTVCRVRQPQVEFKIGVRNVRVCPPPVVILLGLR